jgi:hypothetical protein
MEKEFVTYKLALKMYLLGYNERNIYHYCNGLLQEGITYNSDDIIRPYESVSAPLYQQAFRWFRENYNWTIKVNQVTKNNWSYTLSNFPNDGTYYGDLFKTYEEAELACLEKLIEIVEINNTK